MYDISESHQLVQQARERAALTQQELARRAATSQSAVARLELGVSNPTVGTLARCAAAAGFALRVELVPLSDPDPVVERYKRDVDRTLLRENLRKPVEQRLRSLAEWQAAGQALERATRQARRRR